MHQVKLFKGVESELSVLEGEINAWLSDNDVKVVNMVGNIAPQTGRTEGGGMGGRSFHASDLFLAVVYEQ